MIPSENSASYYGILPANVRYCKELEPQAKLLYVEITALARREGYCWATNAYFAEFFEVDERTIIRWLDKLETKGFIKREIKKKGLQTERKIWIAGEGFKKCLRDDKNVMVEGGKNVMVEGVKNVTPNNISELDKCLSNDKHIGVKGSAAPPPLPPPSPRSPPAPRALTFSFEKERFLGLEKSDVAKWQELYPAIDCERQIALMVEWCLSNPQKAKSKKLWRKFITTWLERQNENQINQQGKRDSYVTNNKRNTVRRGNTTSPAGTTGGNVEGDRILSAKERAEFWADL